MFRSVQRRSGGRAAIAIDIAPLIDVVFILLIFFLVSTTFLRDTGIEDGTVFAAGRREVVGKDVFAQLGVGRPAQVAEVALLQGRVEFDLLAGSRCDRAGGFVRSLEVA